MIPEIRINQQTIEPVGIGNINVQEIRQVSSSRVWEIQQPWTGYMDVPVTVYVGSPIVNMPGCVKGHKENVKNPIMDLIN